MRAIHRRDRRCRRLLPRAFPVLADIVDWHRRGTRYGIGDDPADGLLRAGEPGVQLTWMDAKVGDWVVTPRIGKPVEINALWYNALADHGRLCARRSSGRRSMRRRGGAPAPASPASGATAAGHCRRDRRARTATTPASAEPDLRRLPAAQPARRRPCRPRGRRLRAPPPDLLRAALASRPGSAEYRPRSRRRAARATAAITRARCGPGSWGHFARATYRVTGRCRRSTGAAPADARRSSPIRASARSARSSTAIPRTCRAAPRAGLVRRLDAPGLARSSGGPRHGRGERCQARLTLNEPGSKRCARRVENWRRWGPFVSERQWGTVREDYSPYGTAWDYFSHDQAAAAPIAGARTASPAGATTASYSASRSPFGTARTRS